VPIPSSRVLGSVLLNTARTDTPIKTGSVQFNNARLVTESVKAAYIPVTPKVTVFHHYVSFNKLRPLKSKSTLTSLTPKKEDNKLVDDLMQHLTEQRI
jgi:hypothetical protein